MSLSQIALVKETDEKIKQKLQTTTSRQAVNWKIGDYIFLESPGEDDK
jgi:hypothetical protein